MRQVPRSSRAKKGENIDLAHLVKQTHSRHNSNAAANSDWL